MVWQRDRLVEVATTRLAERAKLRPVERAALAYARWQGLTDEQGIDREAAKRSLDRALRELDAVGPEGWAEFDAQAAKVGDFALIGLMQYSIEQSATQMRELAQATTEPTLADDGAPEPDSEGAPARTPTTRRNRTRNRDR